MAARCEGNKRRRPRWCSDGVKSGSSANYNAMEMQGNRDEDEAEETQCGIDEHGAVVKRRNRPMDEAAVMQKSSHEDNAVVLHRSGDEDEAEERQCNPDEDKAVVMQ